MNTDRMIAPILVRSGSFRPVGSGTITSTTTGIGGIGIGGIGIGGSSISGIGGTTTAPPMRQQSERARRALMDELGEL